jgi:hypothetical protein
MPGGFHAGPPADKLPLRLDLVGRFENRVHHAVTGQRNPTFSGCLQAAPVPAR